jgi:hypothetical protein
MAVAFVDAHSGVAASAIHANITGKALRKTAIRVFV